MAENRSDVSTERPKTEGRRQEPGRQQTERADQRFSRESAPQQRSGGLARQQPTFFTSPFALLERLADEMAGVFGRTPQSRQGLSPRSISLPGEWQPNVDVFHRGNELVVRADLPGMAAEDVTVEISDDALTISGERREEREEDRGGVYQFERTYGSFFRVVPLPEGAITDQAKANFHNGVLEIAVPAPPEQVSRGRRVEITRGEGGAQRAQGGERGTSAQSGGGTGQDQTRRS